MSAGPPSWFQPAEPQAADLSAAESPGAASRAADLPAAEILPAERIPQPRRPALTAQPEPSRAAEWAVARCDEVVGDLRGALWRFTEAVAGVLYPGLGPAVAAAGRVTKWGPALIGLNDERGADVKIGMLGSDNLGLWLVVRTRLGQTDHGPRPAWCADLPAGSPGSWGTEGLRETARMITATEDVKPADVAPLLVTPPPAGAATRLLARVDVVRRAGVVAVDPGDGTWLVRGYFTVVHPARRGDDHHETYRVVCPVCDRRRLAQFRGFDVCSDCGWVHIQP